MDSIEYLETVELEKQIGGNQVPVYSNLLSSISTDPTLVIGSEISLWKIKELIGFAANGIESVTIRNPELPIKKACYQ